MLVACPESKRQMLRWQSGQMQLCVEQPSERTSGVQISPSAQERGNSMNTKKIIWMADESLGNSDPQTWDTILTQQRELIALIGKEEFAHEVLDPRICWKNLVRQISGQEFTTIIDLSGMFGKALQILFPNSALIAEFHISRVRDISAEGLPTTGHVSSLSIDQLRHRKQQLDLSRVLIVDDTSFSGASSEIAMQFWGLTPEQTAHAFLLGNTGEFPSGEGAKPGAVQRLQGKGSQVFIGHEIKTPEEDGWHLKDLVDHSNIDKALRTCLIQGKQDEQVLLGQSFTTEEILAMVEEGRMMLTQQPKEGGIHARNPFLWATEGIWEHVDKEKVRAHFGQVLPLLLSIQSLTTTPEGKIKAREGFERETMILLQNMKIEGSMTRKEGRL